MLYGFYPSRYVNHSIVDLRPAMKLKSIISHIKKVPKGTRLSYGLTFETARESKIATVPAGYADGYRRDLSNRGVVFVEGKRAQIVGRVCMDQFMIDVTGVSGVGVGDTITLLGDGSNGAPTIEEVAKILGTITHEITCSISRRVPRVYIKDNNVVGFTDILNP
jgi:alanine racemase